MAMPAIRAQHATQIRDATLMVLALELFRRRHGGYPAAPEALVPSLLPAVPVDRFDGRPLRYRLLDGRASVYSVGPDGDDDGGCPPQSRQRMPAFPMYARGNDHDADWVFWPPVRYDPQSGELIDRFGR